MSLSSQSRRVVYNGNSSTTAFSIPFSFQSNTSYVGAKLYTDDDTITTWVYSTDFTVSGSTLTAVVAPATGKKLIIFSQVPLTQTEDYTDEVPFLPTNFENGLDKLDQQVQQLDEALKRAPKWNMATSLSNVEMPATITADSTLVSNVGGTGLKWGPSVSDIEGWADTAETAAANAATSASSASSSASTATAAAAAAAASAAAAAVSAATAAAAVDLPAQELIVGVYAAGNTTYTLDHTPSSAATVLALLGTNPQSNIGLGGADYTMAGAVITFTGQDTTGSNLLVLYRY